MHGVDLNLDRQIKWLELFANSYAQFPEYGPEPLPGLRFRTDNNMYGLADAGVLYSFLRALKPRRIIEVGSGFSTAAMLDTLDHHFDVWPDVTLVEPYSERLRSVLHPGDHERVRILEQQAQRVDPTVWGELRADDLLIIDSSHVAKTGSDVNHLYFEVVPTLAPGVMIHIHDMPYPFEYPARWVLEGRAWNEVYLVRALLMFNSVFRIEFWNSCLHTLRRDHYQDVPRLRGGSQLWIRRPG